MTLIKSRIGVIQTMDGDGGRRTFLDSIEARDIFMLRANSIEIWSENSSDFIDESIDAVEQGLRYIERVLEIPLQQKPNLVLLKGNTYGIFCFPDSPVCVPWRESWEYMANVWHYLHECIEHNIIFAFQNTPRWFKEGAAQLGAYLAVSSIYGIEATDALVKRYYGGETVSIEDLKTWPASSGFIQADSLSSLDEFLTNMAFVSHRREQPWYRAILDLFLVWNHNGFRIPEAFAELREDAEPDRLLLCWDDKYGDKK